MLWVGAGKESMQSRKTHRCSLARSIMLKSMGWRTKSHGTRGTALKWWKPNSRISMSTAWCSLVPRGAVGQIYHMGVTTPLTKAGPSYRSDAVFDLSQMQPYTLFDLLVPLQTYTKDIVLYLPRTSDLRQLAVTTQKGIKLTVVHYCMEGASKVVWLRSVMWIKYWRRAGHLRILWWFPIY